MPDLVKILAPKKIAALKKDRRYKTNSTTWRKLRAAQLHRKPLCEDCKESGRVTPANTVDHIDGDTWNNQPHNFRSLCTRCHTIKTNKHDGGLGNRIHRAQ